VTEKRGPGAPDHEVVIIGAGFGGLGMGYQFSFEKNPGWSRVFAKGEEVKAYIDKYGLRSHLRLNTEVRGRRWDSDGHLWRLFLAEGEITARHVISAIGAFVDPRDPEIPGLDAFAGKLIRSQQWDHDFDLSGKRVGVIGTGASAVQLIPPLACAAARLHVFQRHPIWVLPKPDFRLPPAAQRMLLLHANPPPHRLVGADRAPPYAPRFAIGRCARSSLRAIASAVSGQLSPTPTTGPSSELASNWSPKASRASPRLAS